MKLKPLNHFLIKFGVSEHKRVNYLLFFKNAAKAFVELNNENVNNHELIQRIFQKHNVFENKQEINVNREMSFFKTHFFLYLNKNGKIKPTMLAYKLCNDDEKKRYFGKSYSEWIFLLFIIQHKTYNERFQFEFACNLALENKFTLEEFTTKIYRLNEKDIETELDYESLYHLMMYRSGIPEVNKNFEIKKLQNLRDEILKQITKCLVLTRKNQLQEEDVIDYLFLIKEFLKQQSIANKLTYKPTALFKIFDLQQSDLNIIQFGNNFELTKLKEKIYQLIINIDVNQLIIDFYYQKSAGDYLYLIKKHLFTTGLFKIANNFVKIEDNYLNLVELILKNYQELVKIDLSQGEFNERLIELGIIDKQLNYDYYANINEIINQHYDEQFFEEFYQAISKKDVNKNLNYLASKNKHINSVINGPTFFEFVINICFFKLIYQQELRQGINLNQTFIKSINTHLTANFIPLRFASGGRADAYFKILDLIIEPTLQLKNQTKHELNSIANHVKKYRAKYAIMVAPSIEPDFWNFIVHYNNSTTWTLIPLSATMIRNLSTNNKNLDDLKKILNDFSKTTDYNNLQALSIKYLIDFVNSDILINNQRDFF